MRRVALGLGLALALATLAAGCSVGRDSSAAAYVDEDCARADLHGHSVARVWDEAVLDAIRRDVPAPTVHARNLFHVSAAMWDAWAAYEPAADGYIVHEERSADDVRAAREAARNAVAPRVRRTSRVTAATRYGRTRNTTTPAAAATSNGVNDTTGSAPAPRGPRATDPTG